MSSFTVIVPALNEEANIRPTLEAILKEIGTASTFLEVLVFDDASADRTGEVAEEVAAEDKRVQVIRNSERRNIGGIYKMGIQLARGDYLFLIPGDNEIRLDEVRRALQYLHRADLLVFYVLNPEVRPWIRQKLSKLYVLIVNLLFGTKFHYTNGTNVFRTSLLRGIRIETDGFMYQTEALVKAVRSGVDFVQVGIKLRGREQGRSKALSLRNVISVGIALCRLRSEIRVRERGVYKRRGRLIATF